MTDKEKQKQEAIDKAENFVEEANRILNNNYSTMSLADERSLPATSVDEKVELHNCAIATVHVRPNDYNTHIEDEKARRYAEEIASIAAGHKARYLTGTREAREESNKGHGNYPDGLRVLKIGGTERRGYPIFEIEYKVPCFI